MVVSGGATTGSRQKKAVLPNVAATIAFIKMRRKETREKSAVFEKSGPTAASEKEKSLSQKFVEEFLTEDAANGL